MDIYSLYTKVMLNEMRHAKSNWSIPTANPANNIANKLSKITQDTLKPYDHDTIFKAFKNEVAYRLDNLNEKLINTVIDETLSHYQKNGLVSPDEYGERNFYIRELICTYKLAAIFTALQYDCHEKPPLLQVSTRNLSQYERQKINLLDYKIKKGKSVYCRTSELLTYSWFEMPKLADYDKTGFFTSLIVMRTLQVHNKWYNWRQ